jgi:carbon monoxide dehydrogenase subunit G
MEFRRSARIDAPVADVWALVDDIPTVASCIPGVTDVEMKGEREFDCVVTQRVGSVKSSFAIVAQMTDVVPRERVTLVCEGRDKVLGSNVRATIRFDLGDEGEATAVDILADFQVTGRIATFGQRIIAAKAEQVVMKALRNVEQLLVERRSAPAETDRR